MIVYILIAKARDTGVVTCHSKVVSDNVSVYFIYNDYDFFKCKSMKFIIE